MDATQAKARIAAIEEEIQALSNAKDDFLAVHAMKAQALNAERDGLAVDLKAMALIDSMAPEELDAMRRRVLAEAHDQERVVS